MRSQGFNLIEIMVVMAIAGIILAVAVPSFQESMTSSRTRAVAESIHSGLTLARSEAIRRNAPMRFQLVSAVPTATNPWAVCALSDATTRWLVTQFTTAAFPASAAATCSSTANTCGIPAGSMCDAKPYNPPDQEDPCATTTVYNGTKTCVTDPFIAHKSPTDVIPNIQVSTTKGAMTSPAAFVVTFGALGQLLANREGVVPPAPSVDNPGSIVVYSILVSPQTGYSGRRYQIQVNTRGGIKLCNAGLTLPSTDPTACQAL